jgi:hypothetical protein
MSRTITSEPVARFAGPPADRMAGRAQARVARMQAAGKGGHFVQASTAEPRVSAATAARANAFLRREQVLDNAIHQGVISAGLRAHFATLYDADPQGTQAHLASIGLRDAPAADAYVESGLSPGERARIAAAHEGRSTGRFVHGGL